LTLAHPHTRISLPAVEALSLDPILFTQVPPLTAVLAKFSATVDEASASAPAGFDKNQIMQTLSDLAVPYLQSLAKVRSGETRTITFPATPARLLAWSRATQMLAAAVPTSKLFPLVDMWRLAVLDPAVVTWLTALPPSSPNPLDITLAQGAEMAASTAPETRNTMLTTLRLLANALGAPTLMSKLCGPGDARARVMEILVSSLLHVDAQVRTAAASVAFNVAGALQRRRVDRVKAGRSEPVSDDLDGEWEVEMVSAIVEAIQRETVSEDVGQSRPAFPTCHLLMR
jgi:hypothetical protein